MWGTGSPLPRPFTSCLLRSVIMPFKVGHLLDVNSVCLLPYLCLLTLTVDITIYLRENRLREKIYN